MKTVRMIGLALFAILLCVNFTSCSSNDDVEPDAPQKPKEYVVSLGFTGEISVSESPLSRASGNDLYGIQVYSCPNLEGSTTYSYYAKGLFDDTSLMTLKLLEGYKYKFVATMVVDGKNQICYNGCYLSPFNEELTNSFTYSLTDYIFGLDRGTTTLVNSLECKIPKVDRYYGETTDYIPAENSNVIINMKRTVFGAKFVADNLEEGTVSISMKNATKVEITHPKTESEGIFTFSNVGDAYANDEYTETISTEIIWTKADGVVVPLGTHNITFKRNVLTTITIKVADATIENGIGITIDDEEKNMGEGDNLTVENGEITDTTVGTETETEG
jgi:hypothetical protein